MSGWIKLHRVLASSAIGNKPDYLAVWVHLLLSATHRPREILVGRQIVQLDAGQLVFGRKAFSAKTGVSEAVIRSALDAFKSLKQITIKTTTKYSIITVTKWSEYQSEEPANNLKKTSKQPTVNHKQEGKELQEEDKKPCDQQAESRDLLGDGSDEKTSTLRIPYDKILASFRQRLPSFPQPRKLDPDRQKAVRLIWTREPEYGSIEFFDNYFDHISKSPFLLGETGWKACCFDWIMAPKNFRKIIEGNYDEGKYNA